MMNKSIKVKEIKITKAVPGYTCRQPFIIAEIGTSHAGTMSKAVELICAAAESGADAAKFQIVLADEIVHPAAGSIYLPGGSTEIYKAFKQCEQNIDFYYQIKEECEKNNIIFMASVFGSESLKQYMQLNPSYIKLASPELNYYPLINEMNKTQLPVIASTGVSKLKDIDNAVNEIKNLGALLHCLTHYPAQESHCNLRVIQQFINRYQIASGFSDHTADPIAAPLTALYYGASIIEKHITLSKKDGGLDDTFALTPDLFKKMSNSLHQFANIKVEDFRLNLIGLIGAKRLKKLSGSGRKKLSPAEKKIYRSTNRSWVALSDLKPGMILSKKNCVALRSETNRKPGIPLQTHFNPFGKIVKKHITGGNGIQIKELK